MAIVTVNLNNPLNVSCQIGDTAYYVNTGSDGGFTVNSGDIVEIGTIVEIVDRDGTPTLKVYSVLGGWSGELPGTNFVLFSKDNKANLSSPLGYYASVKLVNDSTVEAELYGTGMDVFASST
jgi:hypothetical protein